MISPGKPSEPVTPLSNSGETKVYHCGPLTYTKMGLAILFAWLLWGDFCFVLMEAVAPPALQLKLKALGASNTTMAVILSVLPGILNMTVCPWVSFSSDRHRGRWGRRIPYILWTLPFLTLSLILLGWSQQLSNMLQRAIPLFANIAPATMTISLILVLYVTFQFFNMFVGSVFWYLFNDVVPPQFLGRFMGMFRIVSSGAGALYNYYLLQYSESYMGWILTGGALLYFVGFGIVCLRVKEGPYPPPSEAETHGGMIEAFKAFGKQSFSARFYWYFYLAQTAQFAGNAYLIYVLFFNRQMGLSVDQYGKLTAYSLVATLVATYLTAIFVDRWHPLRVRAYLSVFTATTGFGGWIWLAMTLPPDVFFWISLGGLLVYNFGQTLFDACSIPMFMRLMPKSLYGQFSAANNMIRTIGAIVAGYLIGICLDGITHLYGGSDFAYRWIFAWPWLFSIAGSVFLCLGYREWKRLGGDENYRPPAPWKPEGFEEVADKVKSVAQNPRIVMMAMWLAVGGVAVNVLLVLVFMHYMREHELLRSALWYAKVFIPIKLGLGVLAWLQLRHVRRDIAAQQRGQSTRMGIPHHGVLMVNAIQGLAFYLVYWYQMIKMIELNLDHELILFGIANLMSTTGVIVGVQILRWVERPVGSAAETRAPQMDDLDASPIATR